MRCHREAPLGHETDRPTDQQIDSPGHGNIKLPIRRREMRVGVAPFYGTLCYQKRMERMLSCMDEGTWEDVRMEVNMQEEEGWRARYCSLEQ